MGRPKNGFSGRFAIRNVENVKLLDTVSLELFAESVNPKTAPITQTVDMNYATGGSGNSRGAVFKSNKNLEVTLQDAYFDIALTGEQMGEHDLIVSNVTYDKVYTTTVADSLELDKALATNGAITVMEVLTEACKTESRRFTKVTETPDADEYSITGDNITFSTSDVAVGSIIRVIQDITTTNAVDKFTSNADDFAGTYTAKILAVVEDVINSKSYFAEITIPRANLSDALSLSLQNDGEVAVHDATLSALVNTCTKELWSMVIYNDSDLQ